MSLETRDIAWYKAKAKEINSELYQIWNIKHGRKWPIEEWVYKFARSERGRKLWERIISF